MILFSTPDSKDVPIVVKIEAREDWTFENSSSNGVPKLIKATVIALLTFCPPNSMFSAIFLKASSVVPDASFILPNSSLSLPPLLAVKSKAACNPSVVVNNSAILVTLPPVAVLTASKTPDSPVDSKAVALKATPNSSAFLLAESVGLMMDSRILRTPVMA